VSAWAAPDAALVTIRPIAAADLSRATAHLTGQAVRNMMIVICAGGFRYPRIIGRASEHQRRRVKVFD